MSKETVLGEAQGRDIHDGKERKFAKLRPSQLSLFQKFLPEDDRYWLSYSNREILGLKEW